MAEKIRRVGDALVVDGALGLGTEEPKRRLHVEGGSIHTGGPGGGYSFAGPDVAGVPDEPADGERWVWYAARGQARLWSGTDAVTVEPSGAGSGAFRAQVRGELLARSVRAEELLARRARLEEVVAERLHGAGGTAPVVRVVASAVSLVDPAAPAALADRPQARSRGAGRCVAPTPPPPAGAVGAAAGYEAPARHEAPARLALMHDFGPTRDALVLNSHQRYADGVRVEGNLHIDGVLSQASSAARKEAVEPLAAADALAALDGLSPVTFRYRADSAGSRRAGFLAEDLPDLVALPDRDRLSPVDILAVLTAAVRQQQRVLAELSDRVAALARAQTSGPAQPPPADTSR